MRYLIKAKGWIGADAIHESNVSAQDAGEKWARAQASPTPGEIEIYPLGEPERFIVKVEHVSVTPARADPLARMAEESRERAKAEAMEKAKAATTTRDGKSQALALPSNLG